MPIITQYRTNGGVSITRSVEEVPLESALQRVHGAIDTHCGAIFASGYEYPGRYSRWDIGFVDPPIEFMGYGRRFVIRALNERGRILLLVFRTVLENHPHIVGDIIRSGDTLTGQVAPMSASFSEEDRLHQPTIFSVLRTLVWQFGHAEDQHFGFYGAFGYDLVFQVEPIVLRHLRSEDRPDLHLFLPDELVVVDHRKERAHRYRYDFRSGEYDTAGLPRTGEAIPFRPGTYSQETSDHKPGEYVKKVEEIIRGARRGEFFEVVLSQVLSAGFSGMPSALFETIRRTNPSPYEFLINLGSEQLVGASPEMFVQVEGSRVETCPISGTIRRGKTAIEDEEQRLTLLNSEKDRAELTMCTDVDRNDKARVCEAGTVKIIERCLIEAYSRLFHTVDHVVGELRQPYDAFDALLAHMWAGTLTGAPKPAAMQMIENLENSARRWYGGCVGMLLCNGDIKTGITIRTVHLEDGVASVRVGSTLLAHSDPESEEAETRLKASAFMDAVLGRSKAVAVGIGTDIRTGAGKKVLLVDNRDSFVHTLGDYVRQTGAAVTTQRAGFNYSLLDESRPDVVVISPGPGRPADFGVPSLVMECVKRGIPVFGVCLGLQGIVEAFSGILGVLEHPAHGVGSLVRSTQQGILCGLPMEFMAGRYHSLYAVEDTLPKCLEVLARTEDGTIMAVQHKVHPIAGVQFHPESLLTLKDDLGLHLIANVMKMLS
ncbi:MAG: anthranilate synthase component I [Candidatus Moraniibacteriota bacterium]